MFFGLCISSIYPLDLFVVNNINGGRWLTPFAVVDLFERQQSLILMHQEDNERLSKLVEELKKDKCAMDHSYTESLKPWTREQEAAALDNFLGEKHFAEQIEEGWDAGVKFAISNLKSIILKNERMDAALKEVERLRQHSHAVMNLILHRGHESTDENSKKWLKEMMDKLKEEKMTNRMTHRKLNEIMDRCVAATPGPWKVSGRDKHIIGNDYEDAVKLGVRHCQWTHNTTRENAEFIVNARTDIPDLVAEIRELWEEIERLKNSIGY